MELKLKYIKIIGLAIMTISIFVILFTGLYYFFSDFFSSPTPIAVRIGFTGLIFGVFLFLIVHIIEEFIKEHFAKAKKKNNKE
ncbi:hypothetical protein [Natronospora cellulosivora (SeqCode)]